jgi:hypothetical protein
MSKLWSDFYDFIVPELPGCPFGVIDNALRTAAILFCEMSLAWRAPLADVVVVAGTNTYAYAPPTGTVVHAITYAAFNALEIEAHTGEADIHNRIYDWRNATGTPAYVLGGLTSLILVPNPDADGTLSLIVALKPSTDSTGIDDTLFNEWREGIVAGALSRLMASPKKPYTYPEGVIFHQAQFSIKVGQAGSRVARNYTRASQQTTIMSRSRRDGT